jgi:hypothetical protein
VEVGAGCEGGALGMSGCPSVDISKGLPLSVTMCLVAGLITPSASAIGASVPVPAIAVAGESTKNT